MTDEEPPLMAATPLLFTPIDLRGVRLKNRIVLSPMLTYSGRNGHVSDWHLAHIGKFAVSGVGLVFVESTKVDAGGCTTTGDLGLWSDEFIEPFRRITDFVHGHGAAVAIQLSHSGRKSDGGVPWERLPPGQQRQPRSNTQRIDGAGEWELIGPSAIAHGAGHPVPRAMTHDDIAQIVEAWGQAADRANRAGFDVVEVHAAHGYLIHEFLSPTANRRTDEYGGPLERRMRFGLEVAERVRRSWPDNKPLFFRVSSVDDDGWTIADSVAFARALKTKGVDVIDCSAGGMATAIVPEGGHLRYGYQVKYARQIRAEADIKTMAVGLIIHADHAEQILESGSADLVALGRELMHNPNWPIDAAQKLGLRPSAAQIPTAYSYWLDKRATGFSGTPSTWRSGIEPEQMEQITSA